MLSIIKEFADNSETLKQARSNVEEMSSIKEIGIYIGLFILLFIILKIFTYIFMIYSPIKEDIFVTLGRFIIVPFVIYFYVTKIEKRSWRSIGFSKGNGFSSTLKGLLFGFLMFSAVVAIGMLLGQFRFEGYDLSSLILVIPYFILFAIQCFSEEMYARGWTITYFFKRHSIFLAMVINCIVFALPHLLSPGIDLLSIVNIFIVGMVFAVMFLRFDNIWVCGGVHTAWNFSQGIILGFNVSGYTTPSIMKFSQVGQNLINGGAFGPESSLITTAVFIISLIIAVYYPNRKN
ncbi:CPBP family intramembrane glutamic endopeptidase [Methanobrevibacter sp.]|uniref:CPBP family intramembrane glutamic endopeptidase n=1 Tax=Methanobrevibacter sp. TaxID=66852 RepID=UPI00388DADFD